MRSADARTFPGSKAVRRAVADGLARHKGGGDAAFGLWKGRGVDGLAYQDALRDEWGAIR